MNKDIENIYLDFFSYYDSVKEKFLYIIRICRGEKVSWWRRRGNGNK